MKSISGLHDHLSSSLQLFPTFPCLIFLHSLGRPHRLQGVHDRPLRHVQRHPRGELEADLQGLRYQQRREDQRDGTQEDRQGRILPASLPDAMVSSDQDLFTLFNEEGDADGASQDALVKSGTLLHC